MTTSADLGIPFVASQQATPEITHNEALYLLQALLNGVIDRGRNTPPGSPTEGDAYIVGTAPTGDWSGKANCVAIRTSGGWRFVPGNNSAGTPITMGARQHGMRVWVRDAGGSPATSTLLYWDGSAWQEFVGGGGGGSGTFNGAMVKKSTDQTAANYTTATATAFDAEVYDVGGWHDNVTNNGRLTVPPGVTKVRVTGSVWINSLTASTWFAIILWKNGSNAFDGAAGQVVEHGGTQPIMNFSSGPIEVTAGDYFELALWTESDTSVSVMAARTNFSIEAVP